eukprot:TRINITY_DN1435_c0_g1_i1.p1 TRINITY_DN1435_c0_g1~~TRINITY_DN1435_c0_g1_i1.p1  ORF type:complete len:497 (-),score=143.23 TRINITY_DN1435_c0_g1_i1:61-1551(-)
MEASIQPYVVPVGNTPKVLAIDPAAQADPFYRYKMKQLIVQTIGNGKMIRTAFTNVDEVAKEVKVPPDYIPHYLAKAIGAQAKYDAKKSVQQRASISGEHESKDLSALFIRFIREFIMCPKCKLPELAYKGKREDLEMRCASCGWKGNLSAIAINDKFKRYVYQHPPPAPAARGGKSAQAPATATAKTGGKKTSVAKKAGAAGSSAAAKPAEDEPVVWLTDVSDKAVEERRETMVPDSLKGRGMVLIEGQPDEDSDEEEAAPAKTPLEALKAFITGPPKRTPEEIAAEVATLQSQGRPMKPIVQLLFEVLFPDLPTLQANVAFYKLVLLKVMGTDHLSQIVFLTCLEKKIDTTKGKPKTEFLAKKVLHVFKYLYDEDLLDEDVILQWYEPEDADDGVEGGGSTSNNNNKGNNAGQDPLRKAVAPFCKWLQEAESESDSEDEDDSEEEPAKPAAAKGKAPAASSNGKSSASAASKAPPKKVESSDSEDDLEAEIDDL